MKFRSKKAFTLIELLVVIVIIGILSVVMLAPITALFKSDIQSRQMIQQQASIERTSGWLDSHLSIASRTSIGIVSDDGVATCASATGAVSQRRINPLTLAGDQLVFQSGGKWYRLYYVKSAKEINVAIAKNNVSDICPKRGPNQPNDTATNADDDAVLDLALGPHTDFDSFNLVKGVEKDRPQAAITSYPDPLRMLTFFKRYSRLSSDSLNDEGAPITDIPAQATMKMSDVNNTTPFYGDAENQKSLGSFDFVMYLNSYLTGEQVENKKFRTFKTNISFQQSSEGGQATKPGELRADGIIFGITGNQTITSSFNNINRNSTSDLVSPAVDATSIGQSRWQFNTTVTISDSDGSGYEIRTYLQKRTSGSNPWIDVTDTNNKSYFSTKGQAPSSTAKQTVTQRGAFLIDASADTQTTQYRIRTSAVANTIGSSDTQITLDNDENSESLDYSIWSR